MKYRVGVDVGGTNTDAIIIDENNNIVAKTKTFTTTNVLDGINKAIKEVMGQSNIDPSLVNHAMLGTTQCTNAIVERKQLDKVITVRLAGPATQAILPYCNWPEDVKDKINSKYYVVEGGFEYDGIPMCPINEQQIKELVEENKDCHNYAVSCVFSPVNNSQEEEVRNLIEKYDSEAIVSISSEIGSLSLLERENATILNASLMNVIKNVVNGFKSALAESKIVTDNIYLCQNDGTLMDVEYALSYPVLTIASGPTNSIRGGVYLSNMENAIILDVGGTTSDLGVVSNGFPRETTVESEVGGVSTNFRMPDIVSIAIGGGTIVKEENGEIVIGPESVGYRLSEEALIFGGSTMTLSDIAVRLGYCDFGDKEKVKDIDEAYAKQVYEKVRNIIEDAIDLVKTSNDKGDLVIVGGGSVVIPQEFKNIESTITPDNYDVANAIGASIAKVSGTYEALVSFAKVARDVALENAKKVANENAIKAGAKEDTLEIVDIEEYPIAYHPEEAVKLRVKVVGELGSQ